MPRTPLLLVFLLTISVSACHGGNVSFADGAAVWAGAPVPAWSKQPRLAITDNGDDTLAFVSMDLPQPAVYGYFNIGDIPVELEGPHHIAASPDGAFVFVPLSNYVPGSGAGPHGSHGLGTVPGSLLKIRAADGVNLGESAVDRSPGDIILTRDGKTAYVSHYDLLRLQNQLTGTLPESAGYSTIGVVDLTTMARAQLHPICATAHGIVLSDDEKTLYATCGQTDQIAVMDLLTHDVTRIPVGKAPGLPGQPHYFPYAIARAPADGTLWISCNASGELRVFDPRTGRMDETRTVAVGGSPFFGAFLSDGKTFIVPHQGDDTISIVDTQAAKEVGRIPMPGIACLRAHVALVMPGDKLAYVVCEGEPFTRHGSVVAISLESRSVLGFTEVGVFPDGIAVLPGSP